VAAASVGAGAPRRSSCRDLCEIERSCRKKSTAGKKGEEGASMPFGTHHLGGDVTRVVVTHALRLLCRNFSTRGESLSAT
jgi:hypothetical protein